MYNFLFIKILLKPNVFRVLSKKYFINGNFRPLKLTKQLTFSLNGNLVMKIVFVTNLQYELYW
jgi:hypothetical protein